MDDVDDEVFDVLWEIKTIISDVYFMFRRDNIDRYTGFDVRVIKKPQS